MSARTFERTIIQLQCPRKNKNKKSQLRCSIASLKRSYNFGDSRNNNTSGYYYLSHFTCLMPTPGIGVTSVGNPPWTFFPRHSPIPFTRRTTFSPTTTTMRQSIQSDLPQLQTGTNPHNKTYFEANNSLTLTLTDPQSRNCENWH